MKAQNNSASTALVLTVFFFTLLITVEVTLQIHYRLTNKSWLSERTALPIFERNDTTVYQVRPDLSYEHRTEEFDVVYYTNAEGFRSGENKASTPVLPRKDDQTYRVLFLGSSYAFGIANNYEDLYVTRIGDNLRAEGKTIEYINVSAPGWPVGRHICWLEKFGKIYQPDLLVQTVTGTGVIEPSCNLRPPEEWPEIVDGYIKARAPFKVRLREWGKKFGIVFYIWRMLEQSTYEDQALVDLRNPFATGELSAAGDGKQAGPVTGDEDVQKWAQKKFLEYTNLARAYTSDDVKIAFLHAPMSFVVHPAYTERWKNHGFTEPWSFRVMADRLSRDLNSAGITYINPMNEMIERDKLERTHNFVDIHFTKAGHDEMTKKAIPVLQKIIDGDAAQAGN